MTISSSGLNMNFNPTPTIFERETQGQKDLQNQAEISQKTLQVIQTILNVGVTLTSTGLSITSDVMKIEMEKLLIQIIKLQAQMESGNEFRDEVIALLKKMVQKLLESLEGMGQQISSISQLIKKVYDDASQSTTELYG